MPKESFSKDVYSSSLDHFVNLKTKWKVSLSAMIRRSEELQLLSENQIKYLKDQMTLRRFWQKEPFDDNTKIEMPIMHKQSIHLLLDNNILTPYELQDKLCLSYEEIEKYCFLQKGTLTKNILSKIVELRDYKLR